MKSLFFIFALFIVSGCASYTTPGGPAPLSSLSDSSINELMAMQPAANFPANIAVLRLQSGGYENHYGRGYGSGRFSIVPVRTAETEKDFKNLATLPAVRNVAAVNKILLPHNPDSLKTLREAAARLRADVLLVYTFDTTFHAGEQVLAPLNTVLLGFLNNKKITVTTTASAAFYDVRTEFLYGIAESTVDSSKYASIWSESNAVDDLRVKNEKQALAGLVGEIEITWTGIVASHRSETTNRYSR